MRTLKDDLVTLKILNELFSEDTKVLFTSDKRLKQAIKDLKDELHNTEEMNANVVIDKIMGVWEE